MALSLSNFLYLSTLFSSTLAATRTYDFNVGWVTRNPDGQANRPVIGINDEWPIPRIEATVGDQVIVNLKNSLGNQSTSLHFHGLFQNGTSEMDGVDGATQCSIPPGSSFTYNFTVNQPGTYWYHSHTKAQYPDGLRGPLVVKDPDNPYEGLYDEELILTLSDWYHDEMVPLRAKFLSVTNPTGAEPVPKAALMNDTQNLQINVQPGKTYFVRLINMAAFAAQYFWIDGHTFDIVEVDGVYHKRTEASLIYITAAQRYGFLLTTKNDTSSNFAIQGSMDQDLFDVVPDGLNPNVTSFLVYNAAAPMPEPALLDRFDWFDDTTLVPTDGVQRFENVTQSIELALKMGNLADGANYAFFNDITYVQPKVPTLYTVLSTGEYAADATVYGVNVNPFVLGYQETIEIVLNNHDPGKHPFHLHGHNFQVVVRGEECPDDSPCDFDPNNTTLIDVPMRRDTVLVKPNSHIVLRFQSDNPGVWLFHCHVEWHVDAGLIATMIEAPLEAQKTLDIPANHYAACAAQSPSVPTAGNAAARTTDLLNVDGANVQLPPLPAGFTARGIVALVFSIIAAFIGLASIIWYGMGELNQSEQHRAEGHVTQKEHQSATAGAATVVGDDLSNSSGVEINHRYAGKL